MEHFTPPTRVSARPTQPTETTNILLDLDAVPVPFDFSRSRHDLASRGNGETEGQIKETSLWWYHPTFEARAKADIRRSLSTLLPSDPSQDPSPEDIMGGRRAEVRPRRSRVQIWDLPEDPFGSAPLDRGLGSSKRPAAATEQDDADSLHPQNGADTEVVIANSHRSTPPPILELPSRNRSLSPEDVADEALHPPNADGVVLVEAANGDISESEATALTAAVTPLVKGKTTLDNPKMVRFIDAPREVERANERGSVTRGVRDTSARTRRVTNRRFRPDDAELMSKKDLPDWKRCTWCARRKVKCAPRVGSQPPYRCFHCEDGERECIPCKKKDPRRSGEHQLHPRLKIANNATGASPRRHPRPAGSSHLRDVVIPALPSEEYHMGAVLRAVMRQNELLLAQLQVRNAEAHPYGRTRTQLEGRTRARASKGP